MSEGIYTPPPPPPPPPPASPQLPARDSYDFAKPFSFVFEDPRWLNKILVGGLFYLLAFLIVGAFFILGYMARLGRNVIAGVPQPLPEWDDLGEYFGEGARLVGVVIVWILPLIAIALLFIVPSIALESVDNEAARNLGGCAAGTMWCLMFPLSLAVTFFMPASLMFAITEQRFGAAFELGRIWTFIKANIGDYLLAIVIYFVARFVAGFGIILLCIGVVFTGFWSLTITTYAFAQVYRRAKVR